MHYTLLCIAQIVSMMGSALTGFALSLWYLEAYGSIAGYSVVVFCSVSPMIFSGPFLGVIADRWDRRKVLIGGHASAGLCSLAIIALYYSGHLRLLLLLPLVVLSASANAVLHPTFIAASSLMVSKEQLGRVSGMMGFFQAINMIVVPPLAALLIGWIHLGGILLIDVCTFVFAIAVLLLAKIPNPPRIDRDAKNRFWSELKEGWRYLFDRPSLVAMTLFFWVLGFGVAVVNVLIPPLVLTFGTNVDLARVLAAGGVGILLGGVVLMIWGGPKHKMPVILFFSALMSSTYFSLIPHPTVLILSVAAFVLMFSQAMITGCNQVIWQHKVPPHLQARVFSLFAALSMSAMPFSFLVCGQLAEKFFEPMMQGRGGYAGLFGYLIGLGPGRGMSLMIILMGAVIMVVTFFAWRCDTLRRLDTLLPDQLHPDNPDNPIDTVLAAVSSGSSAEVISESVYMSASRNSSDADVESPKSSKVRCE